MNEERSWLRSNWRTGLALVLIFLLALFLRFYFVYGIAFPAGFYSGGGDYSGGSDSFYWDRALRYSFETGKDLGWDNLLNYPVGVSNPRPPLFPWFSLLSGRLIAPLFGDPWQAVVFMFLLSTGLFGALTVFPTYLLTKEAFGRKAGLIAALLLGISAAHMQRSQATDADHDAFTLFFVVTTFHFFLQALKVLNRRTWVENWSHPSSVTAGVRAFFRENPKSVLYSLLAGLALTVIALAWQGWAYVVVIFLVFFTVELFLDRIRNRDPMGVSILFSTTLLMPLVLALPWYYYRSQIRVWFDVPGYLFLVAVVLGIAFTVTRDYPWTLVIPGTLVAGVAGFLVALLVNPALANALVTGAGYFVPTKVVSTIAEDQAPGLSQLILSFGWFTFYLSLAGVALMLWQLPRRADPAYTLIVIWVFVSVFMAMTAARFIFNGSPAFAVSAAFALDLALSRADFAGMRRSYRSLAEGNWWNAVRKSLKLRHVAAVIAVAFLILLPNVWFAVDAAIPYELKPQYDQQVQSLLPTFLQAPGYTPSGGRSFYFGAFGYSLPRSTQYFPAAWRWFATQDEDQPMELRPAFLSWWDYGFEAVDRGRHPTVADNFQHGVAFAGQFITSQNETRAVALLAFRILEGDFWSHGVSFSPEVRATLARFGLPEEDFRNALRFPANLVPVVKANPVTYGAWDAELQPLNAMYIVAAYLIMSRLSAEQIVDLYHALRDAAGTDIGYFAVDSRLFPISASNTGIFYAPVKLSDHRVVRLADGRTLPFEFFQIYVDTDRGQHRLLQDVQPGERIQSSSIEYETKFYNSIFYRAYIGYTPTDLGSTDKGIPGFTQALQAYAPVPAWNMTHFRVVYRTAYFNPYKDTANHTDAWQAMDFTEAQAIQKEIQAGTREGTVDLSTQSAVANGLVFVRYYDGALVNGTVLAEGGTPLPGVRVTVTDELGTPHGYTTTDEAGRYSILVPFGNITLTASVGNATRTSLVGARTLGTATFPVTLNQALRKGEDLDGNGVPDWLISKDLVAAGRTLAGTAYFDMDRNGAFNTGDLPAKGAVLTFTANDLPLMRSGASDDKGAFSVPAMPDGTYRVSIAINGRDVTGQDVTVGATPSARPDVSVPYAFVQGYARDTQGRSLAGARVIVHDEANGTTFSATASDAGYYLLQPLLLGNVTVTAESGDLAAEPFRVKMENRDFWGNLTLIPSGRVAGVTRVYGSVTPYVTLEFQSASEVRTVRTVGSDGSGTFEIRLPAGDWEVGGRAYLGSSLYATLGRVTVRAGGTSSYTATLVEGARITGTVSDPTSTASDIRALVTFLGDGADWTVRTAGNGSYLAFLPLGTYGLQAYTSTGATFATVTLAPGSRVDLRLAKATSFTGFVYWDKDGNGVLSAGEGIAGARVDFRDDLGRRGIAVTNATGTYIFRAFENHSYAATFSANGFESRSLPLASLPVFRLMATQALVPRPLAVSGAVLLDGMPVLNRVILVQATSIAGGRSAEATTDSTGGYFLSLEPGTYRLSVDTDVPGSTGWRYQTTESPSFIAAVGDGPRSVDVPIAERAQIAGTVTENGSATTAQLAFTGPDRRTVIATPSGFRTYLRAGTYTVYANRTDDQGGSVFLDLLTVTAPATHAFALETAARVTGLTRFDGMAISGVSPVTIVRDDGASLEIPVSSEDRYTAFLPTGSYTTRVDATAPSTEGEVTRYYRYTFEASLVLPSTPLTIPFDLDLSRSLDNTTVVGNVTREGAGVDAILRFQARGGGALNATVNAGGDGRYSVGLAPGTYTLVATRSLGSLAFLGTMTVPHASQTSLDIALRPASLLSGVVTDPLGARVTADVSVASEEGALDLSADASGAYALSLPAGSYTLTATRKGSESGMEVEYGATATVALTVDRVVNLALAKVPKRSVALTWDPSERVEISAGQTVTYHIVLRNTGNVEDTYVLTGLPSSWSFTFSPAEPTADFGATTANRTAITVAIRTPAAALVDHGPIAITATSKADSSARAQVSVEVGIRRFRSLQVTIDASSGTFDGRYLNYTGSVRNAGNALEQVDVSAANPNDLAVSGWSILISRPGVGNASSVLQDLPVRANGSAPIRISLQYSSAVNGATLVLQAVARDDPTIAATTVHALDLPSLAAPGISVTGPRIVREEPLNQLLLGVILAAGAAAAVALFLTRRRH